MSLSTGYCLHDWFDLLDEFCLYSKYTKAITLTWTFSCVHFVLCPKHGNTIEGVVLNRIRVSNPQRLTYTQILVDYPRRISVQWFSHSAQYDWSMVFMAKRLTIYKLYCPHKRFQKSLHWKPYGNNHSPCCLWTGEWRLYLHLKMAVTSHGFKFTRKSISAPRHFYERTLFSVFLLIQLRRCRIKVDWVGWLWSCSNSLVG